MWVLQLIGLAVICCLGACQNFMEDLDEEKAKETMVCMSIIVCKEKKPQEVKRIHDQVGPQLKKLSVEWIRELYEIEFQDTPEFWNSYSDIVCPKSQEEREEFMKNLAMRAGLFSEEKCKNPIDVECRGVNKAMAEAGKIMEEYNARGICGPQAIAKEEMEKSPMKNPMSKMG